MRLYHLPRTDIPGPDPHFAMTVQAHCTRLLFEMRNMIELFGDELFGDCPLFVSQLLHIKLPKTSHDSIKNADHAFDFSYEAIMLMRDKYRQTGASRMHLFISAPNNFNFQLGQHSIVLRNITLYDFDLESGKVGAYSTSIQV